MNCSVKFFEPTAIVPLEALAGSLAMTLVSLAAGVVSPALPTVSSSSPQAARPKVRQMAASAARILRCDEVMLTLVSFGWGVRIAGAKPGRRASGLLE